MAQTWNTAGNPAAATTGQALSVFNGYMRNGVLTALTEYSGSSDPSVGAPVAWGVSEVGVRWLDTTDPDTVVRKVWQRLTAGPTYGWRTLRTPKELWPTALVAVVGAASTAVDVAYGDQSLAAIADASLQDAGQVLPLVKSVTLVVKCRWTAGAHAGGDIGYVKIRNKGGTNERKVYVPPTVNVWMEQEVEVLLDSSEVCQIGVDTNAGAMTVAYQIDAKKAVEHT